MKFKFNKFKAFTLAELMIMLSVLTVLLAAFAPVFTVRYNNASSSEIWNEVPDDEEINIAFREGSYKEYKINGTSESSTQIEVLIDVENTKMTYLASITHGVNNFYGVGLSCTKSDVAKWPETFCVGTNFHSSIDANIANLLPYREIENNELKYTIKHVNNQAKLEVGVEARCNDKKAEDEAIEKAKSLLTKYGISKDQIPVQVDHGVCKAYEDYVDSNGHGNQHLSQ